MQHHGRRATCVRLRQSGDGGLADGQGEPGRSHQSEAIRLLGARAGHRGPDPRKRGRQGWWRQDGRDLEAPLTETIGVGFFSWYFKNQNSKVALTSWEVKATPSCHLTPWRSFQVTSILSPPTLTSPFSRVGTSVASSGTQ